MPGDEGSKRIRQPKLEDLRISKRSRRSESIAKAKAEAVCEDEVRSDDEILRGFDLNMKYGPCCGMDRLKRWERAKRFGLCPPEAVERILRGGASEENNKCIWVGKV